MTSKYKYLKKRALHALAVSYLDYVPICSQCSYKFRGGFEWLTFCTDEKYVEFSVMNGGSWVKVTEQDGIGCMFRSEVLKGVS